MYDDHPRFVTHSLRAEPAKHQFVLFPSLNSIAPGDFPWGDACYSTVRAMVVITVMPWLFMYTAW